MADREFTRWYDKDPRLKEFLVSIEQLDEYSLYLVAKEFLQLIVGKHQGSNDEAINSMNTKNITKFNRWYDWNYDLHTCVEYLKDLDIEDRHELIQEFKEICIQYLADNVNEEEIQ